MNNAAHCVHNQLVNLCVDQARRITESELRLYQLRMIGADPASERLVYEERYLAVERETLLLLEQVADEFRAARCK